MKNDYLYFNYEIFFLSKDGSITAGLKVLEYEKKIGVTRTMTACECEQKLIKMRIYINKFGKVPGMYCQPNKMSTN